MDERDRSLKKLVGARFNLIRKCTTVSEKVFEKTMSQDSKHTRHAAVIGRYKLYKNKRSNNLIHHSSHDMVCKRHLLSGKYY